MNKINKYSITDVTLNKIPQYLEFTRENLKSDIESKKDLDKNILFFGDASKIFVPKKAETALRYYVDKKLLLAIDKDLDIAIEKCLIFLSNLSQCCYNEGRYKILHSRFLHEQSKNGSNTYVYTKIVDLLLIGTPQKGPIIEILKAKNGEDFYYSGANGSKRYRLTPTYNNSGLSIYQIKSQKLIQRRIEFQMKRLKEVSQNVIVKNLLTFYHTIELPTIEEVRAEAERLVKAKYRTKKGKILSRGCRKLAKHVNIKDRAYVEDHIEMYQFYTQNGYMIPSVSSENGGGRVVDSFTLMPSWIRSLIKQNGVSMEELDYTALHPNIAVSIYGGKQKYITHEKLEKALEIPKIEVKKEHLSFFNEEWGNMAVSPLFYYYKCTEPKMMENIFKDKQENGYKATSKRLLTKEVQIMTKVIEFLNDEGIYVGYVYDALLCHPKHRDRVKEVMNYFVVAEGVYTKVK